MRSALRGLAVGLLAVATPGGAHEFWLQPAAFAVAAATPVEVAVLVGDAADVKPWTFRWEKLHSFRDFGPAGLRDLQTGVGGATFATVSLAEPGTHLIALETYHATIELPAAKFNAYLIEDGLTAAIDARRASGKTNTPGREIYSRRAKALVQVGTVAGGAGATDNVLAPIGQTLEIVPGVNPYAPGEGTTMPVTVMFEGRPLPGALVALTALGTGKKPLATRLTDATGATRFDVPRRAAWMISVVWTRPMTGNKLADFETIFASLTFGYPGEHPR